MMHRFLRPAVLLLIGSLVACSPSEGPKRLEASYSAEEKSIAQLQADLSAGTVTSVQLVEHYLLRIATLDRNGPQLNSVLALNPDAMTIAQALDAERASKGPRGPLHGIPLLLKDNIESADLLPTTAGSLALQDNVTQRDAPLVKRLRDAGAIILGKTNLSEWANMRSSASISGWSAIGGLTRNPYAIDRNPCGSSSGSAVATAASLAAASIGTETDGSITCPAAVNGLVGVKPTRGLISRRYIVPIAHSQDTTGPMTRTVHDAALLLSVLAGTDAADPATAQADQHKQAYHELLQDGALQGKRLGVLRFATGYHRELDAVFDNTLSELQAAGAELIDIDSFPALAQISENELIVLLTELKLGLNAYLADSPAKLPARTLAELIAFNEEHAEQELRYFGQEWFEQAEARSADARYQRALADNARLADSEGLAALFKQHQLDAVIAPTTGPAWSTDLVNGDHYLGSVSTLPAVAGYPHVTVPMGMVKGLPVGLSFIGKPWSEAQLLRFAYDFEQRSQARQPPSYVETIELPELAPPEDVDAGGVALPPRHANPDVSQP